MGTIQQNFADVQQRINAAVHKYQRIPGSVSLLAMSKAQPAERVHEAFALGQRCFGENYIQESLNKIHALQGHQIEWHFTGPIQSNKTRPIAENFDWVHSVDRLKVAQRLSDQRPPQLPPLNICIQVNVDKDPNKSGIAPAQLHALVNAVAKLPALQLRGLMTIPLNRDVSDENNWDEQCRCFHMLAVLKEQLLADGWPLDTLSMGMSNDLEAAIAEGATIVRIGSAIFGERPAFSKPRT